MFTDQSVDRTIDQPDNRIKTGELGVFGPSRLELGLKSSSDRANNGFEIDCNL